MNYSEKSFFSIREAAEIAGFKTAMMVDYLCRSGIVVPSKLSKPGRGRTRLFTLGDLILLRAIHRLLSSGLPVSRLKQGMLTLRKRLRSQRPESAIAKYLITDGQNVYLEDDPGVLVNLNRDGQLAFAFIIDLGHAKDDVLKRISA